MTDVGKSELWKNDKYQICFLGVVFSPNFPEKFPKEYDGKTETIEVKEGQLVGIQFSYWNPPNQFIASGVLRIVDGTGTVLLEKDSYQSNFSTIPSDISTTSSNRVDIYFESRQMELINFTLQLCALHKVCKPNFGKNGQNPQKKLFHNQPNINYKLFLHFCSWPSSSRVSPETSIVIKWFSTRCVMRTKTGGGVWVGLHWHQVLWWIFSLRFISGLSKTEIYHTGSFCPHLHPPTPGQPCTLPGNLNCSYDGATITDNDHCCCGRCPDTITMSCLPDNSTTGAGIWQLQPACPQPCHPCNVPGLPGLPALPAPPGAAYCEGECRRKIYSECSDPSHVPALPVLTTHELPLLWFSITIKYL